jgi:hypothetical protein
VKLFGELYSIADMDSNDLQSLAQASLNSIPNLVDPNDPVHTVNTPQIFVQTEVQHPYTRYSSTPWSERSQSISSSISTSLSPAPPARQSITSSRSNSTSLSPYPDQRTPRSSLSRPPLSESPIPAVLQSIEHSNSASQDARNKGEGVRSETDKTALLRICLQKQALYGKIAMKAFYTGVGEAFKAYTGAKDHQTLQRAVNRWAKERREYLLAIGSGEEPVTSSYTQAIDDWIEVLDAYKSLQAERKEAKGEVDKETEKSIQWRQNQFATFLQKTTFESEDESVTTLSSSPSPEPTPLSPGNSTPITPTLEATAKSTAKRTKRRHKSPKRLPKRQKKADFNNELLSNIGQLTKQLVAEGDSDNIEQYIELTTQVSSIEKKVEEKVKGVEKLVEEVNERISSVEDNIKVMLAILQKK